MINKWIVYDAELDSVHLCDSKSEAKAKAAYESVSGFAARLPSDSGEHIVCDAESGEVIMFDDFQVAQKYFDSLASGFLIRDFKKKKVN